MEESAEKIITIIWIGLVPPVVTLILCTFILLSLESAKIGHNLMCSALIGRLGHCTIVVIMWSVFTLEHWHWPKAQCYILTWAWITFWIGDILNTFFFLIYYSFTYGAKKSGKRVSGYLIMFFTWMFSLLIGGLPVFMETSFHNYNEEEESCVLDFVKSERHVKIAGVLVHIIGPLFCFVLCIAINVEFKSLRAKHAVYCRINSLNIEGTRAHSNSDDPVSDKSPVESGSNNSSVRTAVVSDSYANNNNDDKTTNSLARRQVRKCGVVVRGGRDGLKECEYTGNIRDTRNMLNVLTVCTILLNSGPQLVLYVLEIVSGDLAVYTHYILVSAGIIHGLALPILTCLATYRYSYLAANLIKRFCCRRKNIKNTPPETQKNNLSTTTDTQNGKPPSNIVTVSNIVESNSIQDEETGTNSTIDLEQQVTVHKVIIPEEQGNLGLTPPPPPLPTSRHPSFNQTRQNTTGNNDNLQKTQNGQIKTNQSEDHQTGSDDTGHVQINIEDVLNIIETQIQPTENNQDEQHGLDMSIKSVNIDLLKESNRPQNHLDIPLLARSNSAVAISPRDGEQALATAIRRTTSSADRAGDKKEGPFVDWGQTGPGTGTILIRKIYIQSGDESYLSFDYHHNEISDDIPLNGDNMSDGESSYIEEDDDSSYFDSDSEGWSHMYTDTDMDETLERNKEKRNTVKRAAAKRIPSNDSSLNNQKVRRAKAHKKKHVHKKKSKAKGKNVEKGLGSALQTMMVMPGAQLAHRPKQSSLVNTKPDHLSVNISEDTEKASGQKSPGIGPDGKPIPVPPPPLFTPPPVPSENHGQTPTESNQHQQEQSESTIPNDAKPQLSSHNHDHPQTESNQHQGNHHQATVPTDTNPEQYSPHGLQSQDQDNMQTSRSSSMVFPATVLPFQTTYSTSGSQSLPVSEQQSFTKEAAVSLNTERIAHNNPYLEQLDSKEETQIDESKEASGETPNSQSAAPHNNYHPSIYSIVKERTKAQKAWHNAFHALSVTDFLKRANLGVTKEEDTGSRSRNTVSRTSAHNYVNTGSSGIFADRKQPSVTLNEEEDEWAA